MNNCGTCKHWDIFVHGVRGACRASCAKRQADTVDIEIMKASCRTRYGMGYFRLLTGPNFGCIRWEELPGPFYVDSWTYSEGTRWSVHWSNKPGHCVQVTSSEHSEDEANGVCKILNELWAGRDE